MGQLSNLRYELVSKLCEHADTKQKAIIIIETFVAFMDATEWDEKDVLVVLKDAKDYFQDGFIKEQLTESYSLLLTSIRY